MLHASILSALNAEANDAKYVLDSHCIASRVSSAQADPLVHQTNVLNASHGYINHCAQTRINKCTGFFAW